MKICLEDIHKLEFFCVLICNYSANEARNKLKGKISHTLTSVCIKFGV